MPRYYFDPAAGECKVFIYGGCLGNENNFKTIEACEAKHDDICHQPKKVGSCKAAFSRYYFNSAVGECKEFTYGGCQGNENNFKTLPGLPEKEPGLCLGYFTRFYYDSKAGECKDFIYGECVGNENNFKTLKACKKKCDKKCDICKLQDEAGPCFSSFTRYYYDVTTGKCSTFIYGGCFGNENNFETQEACQRRCVTCKLPAEVGTYRAACALPCYYFDSTAGE
ncbi:unnamed protein product [Pocillopora meandrina]|uniref:BPTI/Kunitz inhibitor domain-containing protein n=1 Tax=Pocillopora meandrina TaxID=46732 RepID=A0AAU9VNJ8_9CNID|nr:unnamed protein product [Pocillopora meandrina]